jgi:isopenicillin N synthase-like dioxygenase
MISRTTDDIPPFPEDVPTAPIGTISLAKIISGDEEESAQAVEATRTSGFFYLDLTTTSLGQDLVNDAEELQALSKQLFDQPLQDKMAYLHTKGNLFGYK